MNLNLDFLRQISHGIAAHFGDDCEVVVHDLTSKDPERSIIVIENGHVTNRKVGDGPSHVVLEALHQDPAILQDHIGYLTKTHDGRILKSSTMYIRNDEGKVTSIFSINYDITKLLMTQDSLKSFLSYEAQTKDPEKITQSVNDLLDELIEQSVKNIGKPVALMTKEDKVSALQFLNDTGAFLITKSGDKVAKYFGISKYTLYSYLDANK